MARQAGADRQGRAQGPREVSSVVDVHALNVALWGILIVSSVATGTVIAGILWVWLAERRRQARQVASGIRAAEQHLMRASRDRTAR